MARGARGQAGSTRAALPARWRPASTYVAERRFATYGLECGEIVHAPADGPQKGTHVDDEAVHHEQCRRRLVRGVGIALGASSRPGAAFRLRHRRLARAQPFLQRLPGGGRAHPLRHSPGGRASVATAMAQRLWGMVRPLGVLAAGDARAALRRLNGGRAAYRLLASLGAPGDRLCAAARPPAGPSATTPWRSRCFSRSRRSSSASRSMSSRQPDLVLRRPGPGTRARLRTAARWRGSRPSPPAWPRRR